MSMHLGVDEMGKPLLASGQATKLVFAFGLFFTALNSPSSAAEIKLISVRTVSPVLHDLIPEYERQSGNKVQVNFGNPAVTLERLTKGDPADIVMVAGALWDQAEKVGRLKAETKTVLPATSYSIGMKPGTKPSAPDEDFDVLNGERNVGRIVAPREKGPATYSGALDGTCRSGGIGAFQSSKLTRESDLRFRAG